MSARPLPTAAPFTSAPAPWTAELFQKANGDAYSIVGPDNVEICGVSPDWPDGGLAHARMLAASPEMANALRNLLMTAKFLKGSCALSVAASIRAAGDITKAEAVLAKAGTEDGK